MAGASSPSSTLPGAGDHDRRREEDQGSGAENRELKRANEILLAASSFSRAGARPATALVVTLINRINSISRDASTDSEQIRGGSQPGWHPRRADARRAWRWAMGSTDGAVREAAANR